MVGLHFDVPREAVAIRSIHLVLIRTVLNQQTKKNGMRLIGQVGVEETCL